MNLTHIDYTNIIIKEPDFFKKFFNNTLTFKDIIKKIKKVSNLYAKFGFKDEYKMQGNLFEIFAEIFFKINNTDNRIGVYDYKVVSDTNDFGVDGYGIGINNQPITIQIKYRNNITHEIISNELKQFAFQSVANKKYNVNINSKTQDMIVFTTCKGLHWNTSTNVYLHKIRVIGYNQISNMIDNNMCFWNLIKKII